jgi:cytochrome c-type biogenesis protein CcmH
MNQLAYFWAIAGFMAGIAAAFFVLRLWSPATSSPAASSSDESVGMMRNKKLIALALLAFVAVAFSVYAWLGKPELASQSASAGATTMSSHAANVMPSAGAGSMVDAVTRLAAKLASGSGTDADWQLLQQSYEFIGDTEGATLAQQHKLKSGAGMAMPNNTSAAEVAAPIDTKVALVSYQQLVARNPKDAAAWLAIAQLQRTARNFPEASAAFEHAVALKAMDADAWADYADVAASVANSLVNATTRSALDAALKLQPQHSKALWLKASLAHEERRYGDALKLWQQLRSTIPDSSPDVTIIDANIQEARALMGSATGQPVKLINQVANQVASAAQIRGSVTLDPALKARLASGMTLFVYAKAPDSPAPVAAYRTTVTTLPVSFVLDDSQAMMPSRKLSQFDQVRVEARLSSSGQALPQPGDLQAEAVTVATHAAQPITLSISKLVP